jgi:hypothetical protein
VPIALLVCSSAHTHTHISLWLPLDRLLSNLILGTVTKIYPENPNLVKIGHLKWRTKYPLLLPVTFYPHKVLSWSERVSGCWDRPAGINIMQVCYNVMVYISCESCVCVYVCMYVKTHTHSFFPTQHHIHFVPIKAYEHKFPNMQYFYLVPFFYIRPQTAVNKQEQYIGVWVYTNYKRFVSHLIQQTL